MSSSRFIAFIAATFVLTLGAALAQTAQPYAGFEVRALKALSDRQVDDLRAGRGMGLALAAELNGYPGPMHVLELKDRLKLTAEQEAKAQELHAAVKAEQPKSTRLLEAERRLERLFADRVATEANVRAAVAEIERARAEVRLVHLLTHLRTRDVLTEDQRRIYHQARWGR
jgi:Spy/CpxP family protein refolding chaperone